MGKQKHVIQLTAAIIYCDHWHLEKPSGRSLNGLNVQSNPKLINTLMESIKTLELQKISSGSRAKEELG